MMEELMEKWSVTYTWHDKDEKWHQDNKIVNAEDIGQALRLVDNYLSQLMEGNHWSDYWVTNINVLPEMH